MTNDSRSGKVSAPLASAADSVAPVRVIQLGAGSRMPLTNERGSAILGIHGLRGGAIMKIQVLAAAIVLLGTGLAAAEATGA